MPVKGNPPCKTEIPQPREKTLIKSQGLNPDNWLIYKKVTNELHLVHCSTDATQIIVNRRREHTRTKIFSTS